MLLILGHNIEEFFLSFDNRSAKKVFFVKISVCQKNNININTQIKWFFLEICIEFSI